MRFIVKGTPKQTISLQIFEKLFSADFTWHILEYLDPIIPGLCFLFELSTFKRASDVY